MKKLCTSMLVAASLVLSSMFCFAADVKAPGKPAEAAKAAAAAPKDAPAAGAVDAKTAAKNTVVDINTATEAELKGIAGIGDAYSAKIIAGRPYANKTQLKSRNILPSNVYEQIKDRIIAKQLKK